MNLGTFIKSRRAIFWTSFTTISLSLLAILVIPPGSYSQPVPPTVTLQSISRAEAGFLYGHHQRLMRHLIWNELSQLEFKQAWHRIQFLRYSHVQTIRKDATNVATLIVIYAPPDRSASTNLEKTYYGAN